MTSLPLAVLRDAPKAATILVQLDCNARCPFCSTRVYTDQGVLQVAALSKHLLPSITIPAGEEGIVIAHFYFPSRCIASQDEIRSGSGLGSQSFEYLSLPASSLGRPSTIDVPLNERFIRPLGHEWGVGGCVEDYYKWINSSQI